MDSNPSSTFPAASPPPRSRRSDWTGILVIALIAAAGLYWLSRRGSEGSQAAVGKPLPAMRFEPLVHAPSALGSDDFRGRVTLINFWGTWCPPCVQEFPHLVELREQFAGTDFLLVSVSCSGQWRPGAGIVEDADDLRQATEAFLARRAVQLPVYADPQGTSRDALHRLVPWRGYPTTLLVDREGVVQGFWVGYQRGVEKQMAAQIAQLLESGAGM